MRRGTWGVGCLPALLAHHHAVTEGTTYTDNLFAANWAGMKQAGVVRSAYHFFHSNVDPTTQANHFLAVMGTLQPGDLPPTLDLEVTDGQSAATITSTTITWLDAVAAATGTKPILYSSSSFISGTLGSPAGLENHAQLWVANWGVTCPNVPSPFTAWPFWQYSATGTVPGIPGRDGGRLGQVQRRNGRAPRAHGRWHFLE